MYIYPHLGLGDHIICHGIVRNICTKYNNDIHELVTKPQFLTSLSFMYRDIKNLKFMSVQNDHEAHVILDPLPEKNKIYIGHHYLQNLMNRGLGFDQAFYEQVGLNFQKRWTDFKIERDFNQEIEFFKKVNPPSKYIFLHDGEERGLYIDRQKIKNQQLEVITPQTTIFTDNIFNYLTLIERAEEIHCFDSSFKLMIDSVLLDRPNLYYHVNLLNCARRPHITFSKLNWNLV